MNDIHVHVHTYRWLKVSGVSIAIEKKMRERAQDLVGDHLLAENAPFSFALKEGGESTVRLCGQFVGQSRVHLREVHVIKQLFLKIE